MLHVALVAPVWFGPATATFPVQFPGDPYDAKRNDVKVRFLGDLDQREERTAWFDPVRGAWRATLFTQREGRYRAVLVRNGKEMQVEASEGILDVDPAPSLGYLTDRATATNRLALDTGAEWVGFGADLGDDATPERVEALAKAGANWVRVVPPTDPLDYDGLVRFGAAMDAVERCGLAYTLPVPASSSDAWRRYALARFGASPRLVGWEGKIADPQGRPTAATAVPWDGLFENRTGPFVVDERDVARLKAIRAAVERSGWAGWDAPRAWKGAGAKGVAESDRLLLLATPGAKLVGLPLAEGDYDLTTIDPTTGAVATGRTRVERAALSLPIPAERFFVLRRRL